MNLVCFYIQEQQVGLNAAIEEEEIIRANMNAADDEDNDVIMDGNAANVEEEINEDDDVLQNNGFVTIFIFSCFSD